MLKLTYHPGRDDEPRSLRFPVDAARFLRSGHVEQEAVPADRGSCDAARRVEAAMKEVELRFSNLRTLLGYTDEPDPDRPCAA